MNLNVAQEHSASERDAYSFQGTRVNDNRFHRITLTTTLLNLRFYLIWAKALLGELFCKFKLNSFKLSKHILTPTKSLGLQFEPSSRAEITARCKFSQ